MEEIDWKREYEFLALALFAHIAILESLNGEGGMEPEEAKEKKKLTYPGYIKAAFRYRNLSDHLKYKIPV